MQVTFIIIYIINLYASYVYVNTDINNCDVYFILHIKLHELGGVQVRHYIYSRLKPRIRKLNTYALNVASSNPAKVLFLDHKIILYQCPI